MLLGEVDRKNDFLLTFSAVQKDGGSSRGGTSVSQGVLHN